MAIRRKYSGQMTVEFVVAFPAMIAVALVAVNAILFFSECAAFDCAFRSAVCTYAASPAYEQGVSQSCVLVESAVRESIQSENTELSVSSSGAEGGMVTFSGELRFAPTLFGKGKLTGAFGVSFPSLTHEEKIAVSAYKPGLVM